MVGFSLGQINTVALFVTAYLAVFLQAALAEWGLYLGGRIDALPALILYAAFTGSFGRVLALGLFGGILFDALSANPLGVSSLSLICLGAICYRGSGIMLRDFPFTQFALGLFVCGLSPVLTVLLLLGMGEAPILGWPTVWQWWVMTIGGAILAPGFFAMFRKLDQWLSHPVAVTTSFREDREIKRGKS